jgi:hypothetical protein
MLSLFSVTFNILSSFYLFIWSHRNITHTLRFKMYWLNSGCLIYIYYFCTAYTFYVRVEIFSAVTRKNAVFWDVVTCRSCFCSHLLTQSLKMEAISSEISVHTKFTWHHIPEDGIFPVYTFLHSFSCICYGLCLSVNTTTT